MSVIRMNFLICRPRERIFPESSGAIEWGEVPEAPFAAGTQVGTIIYTLGEKRSADADRDKDRSPKSRVFHLAGAEPGAAVHIVEIDPDIQIWYNGKMAV